MGCGPSSASGSASRATSARMPGRRLGAAGVRALDAATCPRRSACSAARSHCSRAADERRHELHMRARHRNTRGGLQAWQRRRSRRRSQMRRRPRDNDASNFERGVEAAYGRLLTEPEGAARDLLTVAEGAVPAFEALGDTDRLLATWLLIGLRHAAGCAETTQRGKRRRSGRSSTTGARPFRRRRAAADRAAIYWGPTAGAARDRTLRETRRGRGARPRSDERRSSRSLVAFTPRQAHFRGRGSSSPRRRRAHGPRRSGDCDRLLRNACAPTSSSSPAISHAAEATLREQCDVSRAQT